MSTAEGETEKREKENTPPLAGPFQANLLNLCFHDCLSNFRSMYFFFSAVILYRPPAPVSFVHIVPVLFHRAFVSMSFDANATYCRPCQCLYHQTLSLVSSGITVWPDSRIV